MKKFLLYHLPVILYGSLILTVSSIPNLRTPEIRFLAFDKVAHFVEYALFAFLAFRSLSNLPPRRNGWGAYIATLICMLMFSFLDELVQYYTPGRHWDIFDILTDILSGIMVLGAIRLWYNGIRPSSD